ncbi:MAG TPA: hypothetical protein VLA04_04360 [Verrucomicrobiae bacterium]|nr:hypothetical protein [Verrucomicrobiae bacterium]
MKLLGLFFALLAGSVVWTVTNIPPFAIVVGYGLYELPTLVNLPKAARKATEALELYPLREYHVTMGITGFIVWGLIIAIWTRGPAILFFRTADSGPALCLTLGTLVWVVNFYLYLRGGQALRSQYRKVGQPVSCMGCE